MKDRWMKGRTEEGRKKERNIQAWSHVSAAPVLGVRVG